MQYHFYKHGLTLNLNDASKASQIQIVENPNMVTGTYSVRREGKNLVVTAGDQFGFTGAAEYLTGTLFKQGLTTETLWGDFYHKGVYTREMLENTGEMRVMFQNIWVHNWMENGVAATVTNQETKTSLPYLLAMVKAYRPAVIGFNEFWQSWTDTTEVKLISRMEGLGYGCVYKPTELKKYNPCMDVTSRAANAEADSIIFYDKSQVELVEGSDIWLSYGAFQNASETVNGYTQTKPIVRTSGPYAGYYQDNGSSGMGATIATFKNAKGEQFTVCCTHFESNGTVSERTVPWGNAIRWEQVEKLMVCLNNYQKDFPAPVLIGGDYNSADDYAPGTYTTQMIGDGASHNFSQTFTKADTDVYGSWWNGKGNQTRPILTSACEILKEHDFFNAKTATTNTTYNHSCNGYPTYNAALGAYVKHTGSIVNDPAKDGYNGSIDHIYCKNVTGSTIETLAYRNICDPTTMTYTDHKALLIDFNLNTDKDAECAEYIKDNDIAGETWNGMNDYAAPTEGSGTLGDPYLIERPEHLAWLARATNDAQFASYFLCKIEKSRMAFQGVYFKQTADIDLAGLDFTPIGNYQSYSNYANRHGFGGIYDGDGYAIMNATINAQKNSGSAATAGYATDTYTSGIFGLLAGNAVVKNIKAKNIDVGTILNANATTSAGVFGETFSGVIAGLMIGASTVTNCTTDANCSAAGVYAGGIVGYQNSATEVSYCVNRATVTGDRAAGGIIGAAEAHTITYNVNYGSINLITFKRWAGVGGIIGAYSLNEGNGTQANAVSYCVNAGKLTAIDRNASDGGNQRVGMGGIIGNDDDAKIASYANCFNLASEYTATVENVRGSKNFLASAGGIAGYAMDTTPSVLRTYSNCYTVAGTTDANYYGTAKNDFAWNWNGMNSTQSGVNGSDYAGLMSGDLSDAQVKNAVGADNFEKAFDTCVYGADAADIEANNATYQQILAEAGRQ